MYYTRSYRVNGQVRREYVGAGVAAEVLAQSDELATADRRLKQMETRNAIKQLQELDAMMATAFSNIQGTMHGTLEASGYRQHHRGEWRRARGQ